MKSKLRPWGFHNACRQLYIDKLLYTYRKITDKTNVQVIVYQVSNTETKRYPGRRRVGWEEFDVFFFFDFFFFVWLSRGKEGIIMVIVVK